MINEKQILTQLITLFEKDDRDTIIPINSIVGIDEAENFIYIGHLGIVGMQPLTPLIEVHGGTFTPLSRKLIMKRRKGKDWSYEATVKSEDLKQDLESEDGSIVLEDYIQVANEGLFPFDDDSYREEFESSYKALLEVEQQEICSILGTKGNYKESLNSKKNINSKWVTVSYDSWDWVKKRAGVSKKYSSFSSHEDRVKRWKCNLYPSLTLSLAKLEDMLHAIRDRQETERNFHRRWIP